MSTFNKIEGNKIYRELKSFTVQQNEKLRDNRNKIFLLANRLKVGRGGTKIVFHTKVVRKNSNENQTEG